MGVASTHGLVHCASSQEWRRVVQPPAPPVSSERLRPERRCRRETPWENRSHEAASAVINSTNAVTLGYPAPNRLVSRKAPRIPASTTHEIADRRRDERNKREVWARSRYGDRSQNSPASSVVVSSHVCWHRQQT